MAYIFAHNPAGVIQCGGYTGNGSTNPGNEVELGWEPQLVLVKPATRTGNWSMWDNQRFESTLPARVLLNASSAEQGLGVFEFSPTGFKVKTTSADVNDHGNDYIFMAIRAEGA
ncbi:hypothetical protein J4729_07365 [Leisingera sp. HS039]|uniref:DUF7483 domain-containing protein n=1 Tax=Leisingera sp. HS039 TaxID=2818496 RepID=UPI001B3A5F98|nr:hypothetical protein [Leisingera sp. HS039]MBQ4824367.1 hypothetical protein [Leisingera sp. HS039]